MATQVKTNKATLQQAIEMVHYALRNRHSAVGGGERTRALESMKRNGLAIINLLEQPMNAHAKKLVSEAEALIDKSTQIITTYQVD